MFRRTTQRSQSDAHSNVGDDNRGGVGPRTGDGRLFGRWRGCRDAGEQAAGRGRGEPGDDRRAGAVDRGRRHARRRSRGGREVRVHRGGRRGLRHRVGAGERRDAARPARHAARSRPASRRRRPALLQAEVAETRAAARARARGEAQGGRPRHPAERSTTRASARGGRGAPRRPRRGRSSGRPRRGSPRRCIRAPIDGVVALRSVNVGDRVENMGGALPMFRIVDNRVLDLTVTVPSARSSPSSPSASRSSSPPTRCPGTDVRRHGALHQPVGRRGQPHGQGDRRGAERRRGAASGGLFVKGRIVTGDARGRAAVPRVALLVVGRRDRHGRRLRRRRRGRRAPRSIATGAGRRRRRRGRRGARRRRARS